MKTIILNKDIPSSNVFTKFNEDELEVLYDYIQDNTESQGEEPAESDLDNHIDAMMMPSDQSDQEEKSIKVDNPLDSNKKFLRTNLKNSLIECLKYNEKRQKDSIKLFEISDVYSTKDNLLNQEKRIAIIVSLCSRV